jgi:hypothetical protein
VSRSKSERIKVKMERSSNAGWGSIKSIACRPRRKEIGRILLLRKSILLDFRARAGLTKRYLFF